MSQNWPESLDSTTPPQFSGTQAPENEKNVRDRENTKSTETTYKCN